MTSVTFGTTKTTPACFACLVPTTATLVAIKQTVKHAQTHLIKELSPEAGVLPKMDILMMEPLLPSHVPDNAALVREVRPVVRPVVLSTIWIALVSFVLLL